ncbi:hypothetical protein [Amycolatopsis sp. BJA-103]|uniref:hypothetical protein n=1 Tax=Amycolatopsis sp. BJA-103 TaxID=1911175 RepID=UPI001304B312|nr:hypothetical protein [Amycolatopsis sp. BJA-103]
MRRTIVPFMVAAVVPGFVQGGGATAAAARPDHDAQAGFRRLREVPRDRESYS